MNTDVLILKSKIEQEFGVNLTISKQKSKLVLIANCKSTRIIISKIDKYIPKNIMSRKTGLWRNKEYKLSE